MPFDDTGQGGGRLPSRNVLGGFLAACSIAPVTEAPVTEAPVTGFFRNGCCDTAPEDAGSHTVCAVMTAEFLAFSASRGNDLSTPQPRFGFAGLRPGDRWCLCASRWAEALAASSAPGVILAATHKAALEHCRLEDLKCHEADRDGSGGRI